MNTKVLAKSGLHFTGVSDCAKCAFCGIKLHSWGNKDNPVIEHYKYSPNCRFLSDPSSTLNVVDGVEKDLLQLLSVLKDVRGIDEADGL